MSRKNKAKSQLFKYLAILLIFRCLLKIIEFFVYDGRFASVNNVNLTLSFLEYISWFGGIYILIKAIKLKNDFKNNRIPLIGVIILANMGIINHFIKLITVKTLFAKHYHELTEMS